MMKRLVAGSVLGWLLALLPAVPVFAATDAAALPMRLPAGVNPTAYTLALTVDPNQPTHSGEATIALDVQKAGQTLRLNAKDITISSAVLEAGAAKFTAKPNQRTPDLLDLDFDKPFPAGKAQLKLVFTGHIEDKDSAGLFRQKEGGDWYAFTQFEDISARKAFPSFDEPSWKTPFTLSLTIPEKLTAVASTPMVKEVALGNGQKRVEFLTTKPLPTYLLAFGVGPFDILDGGTAGAKKTPVRFITPRGRGVEATYAAKMTPAIIAKLEAYFGMPYPFEKLDVMALPITLNFTAMENPGLVTFSSLSILAKPGEESVNFRRGLVAVQAHELAHMWFGDYVTMAWWDDLWLNESFASWMGDKITAQVAPEMRVVSSVQGARAWAMQVDRLLSTTAIHQTVASNQDLVGQNAAIRYGKGQAVLAMFETWMGEAKFQAGVRRYMAKHAWGNATGDDFVAAMTQGDAELNAAFKSFIYQPGIPRLGVALSCDGGKPMLKLAQSRFLPKSSAASSAARWSVPVTVRTPAGSAQLLLKDGSGQLTLPVSPGEACPAWVLANVNGAGYYRAVYGPGQMAKLMTGANLSANELLANLDDVLALTESGDLPVADALGLAARFAGHAQREVADAALGIIARMEPLVEPGERAAYAALWQRAYGDKARQLGLLERAGDSDDDRLNRGTWVGRVADQGQDKVLRDQAKALAQTWLQDRKTLTPANRSLVLRTAALDGDKAFFDALVKAVLNNPDRRERSDIYAALGNFRAPDLAAAGRQLLLSPEHDIRELMVASRNRGGAGGGGDNAREAMFSFVTSNFDALAARMPKDAPGAFPRFFMGMCSTQQADAVDKFFGPKASQYEGGIATLQQSLESIRLCAGYRDMQYASLKGYLAQPW
jgi:alanyl aminopeptidase